MYFVCYYCINKKKLRYCKKCKKIICKSCYSFSIQDKKCIKCF